MKKQKGFTLVELLVVIAILGVLAAVGILSYSSFKKKGQRAADITFIAQLNHDAKAQAVNVDGGDYKYVEQVNKALTQYAINDAKFKPSLDDSYFGFNINTDEFVLIEKNAAADANIFIFVSTKEALNEMMGKGYSVYLQDGNYGDSITVTGSVDTGKNIIGQVEYLNSSNKNVIIATGSAYTTLTINDQSEGTIQHYGECGILNIIECHTASYHEFGKVAFAEIKTGHIVLEKSSNVSVINIDKKDEQSYSEIIITDAGLTETNMPEIISRDSVVVPETATNGIVVVTVKKLNNDGTVATTEVVKAYPNTTALSTTEKTNVQNATVQTELGMRVIDDNNKAGQKSYTQEEKQEVINTVVIEAKQEEVTNADNIPANSGVVNVTTNTYYGESSAEFKKAVEEANAGDVVVLLKNITLANQITISKDVTIDLNGKNVVITFETTSYEPLFNLTKHVNFNLKGNGASVTIAEENHSFYSFVNFNNYSSLIKNNVISISDLSFRGVTNGGQLIVCQTTVSKDYKTKLVLNNLNVTLNTVANYEQGGYGDNSNLIMGNYCDIEINGGTYIFNANGSRRLISTSETTICNNVTFITNTVFTENQDNLYLNNCSIGYPQGQGWISTAIASSFGGYACINGGSYTGENAIEVWSSGGSTLVKGGTFTANGYAIHAYGGSDSSRDVAYVAVLGGTFSGALRASGSTKEAVILIQGGTFNNVTFTVDNAKSKIIIIGGTFSSDPSAYVDTTVCDITNNSGVYTVTLKSGVNYVTTANGTKYLVSASDLDTNNKIKSGNYYVAPFDYDLFDNCHKCVDGVVVEYHDQTNSVCYVESNNVKTYYATLEEGAQAYLASTDSWKSFSLFKDVTINGDLNLGEANIKNSSSYTLTVNGKISGGTYDCKIVANSISGGTFKKATTCSNITGGMFSLAINSSDIAANHYIVANGSYYEVVDNIDSFNVTYVKNNMTIYSTYDSLYSSNNSLTLVKDVTSTNAYNYKIYNANGHTLTINNDSYVAIKSSDNSIWYIIKKEFVNSNNELTKAMLASAANAYSFAIASGYEKVGSSTYIVSSADLDSNKKLVKGIYPYNASTILAEGYSFAYAKDSNNVYSYIVGKNVLVVSYKIVAGEYKDDITAYVDTTTYDVVNNNGTYTVSLKAGKEVCSDGTNVYGSLTQAFAQAANNSTITLSKDVTESFSSVAGKTLTLDLNGHTITGQFANCGITTLKSSLDGGKIVYTSGEAISCKGGDTLTVLSGTYTGSTAGLKITSSSLSTVTISGGTFEGTNAIYAYYKCNIVISNCTAATVKVDDKSANVTINGGTFTTVTLSTGTLSITGGTFENAPAKGIATGYHYDSVSKSVIAD